MTQAVPVVSRQQTPSYELVVLGGTSSGRRAAVDLNGVTIGTASTCQLRVQDPTVSRQHCEVKLVGGRPRITDLASTNGVVVSGIPVQEATLPDGATIHLGETVVRVESAAQAVFVELSARSSFGAALGTSKEMRRLFSILEKVAPTDATVLLQGETGVGKEVLARAIHDESPRAEGPFVVVDCGAIAENLIESELFGHTRGAFSGAITNRQGLFEQAHQGTLFLDEIGELPSALQPKLLRVLETRQVRRVGSNASRPIDVRIVAATNVPLAEGVNSGEFREDLYYRIAVVEAQIPPLRQRREDIAPLAEHFYRRYAGLGEVIPEGMIEALCRRAWPGNVRELRNFIERSVSLGWSDDGGEVFRREAARERVAGTVPTHLPLKDARAVWSAQFEQLYVEALLEKTGWDLVQVADLAGVHRRSIQRFVAQFHLRDQRRPPCSKA